MLCKMLKTTFTATVMLLGFSTMAQSTQMLKNSSFALSGGKVCSWFMSPKSMPIESVKEGLPDGVSSALCITIAKEKKYDGQLLQRVYLRKGKYKKLTLSGWMKSAKSRAAYIQVKLYVDKKELKRLTLGYSSQDWDKFNYDINLPSSVNKMEVIFRWRHYAKYLDSKILIADMKLVPPAVKEETAASENGGAK